MKNPDRSSYLIINTKITRTPWYYSWVVYGGPCKGPRILLKRPSSIMFQTSVSRTYKLQNAINSFSTTDTDFLDTLKRTLPNILKKMFPRWWFMKKWTFVITYSCMQKIDMSLLTTEAAKRCLSGVWRLNQTNMSGMWKPPSACETNACRINSLHLISDFQ